LLRSASQAFARTNHTTSKVGIRVRSHGTKGADPVHWAENLDVPDRVEPEAPWYPCLDQFDDARHRGIRLLCLHEVEVAVGAGWAEIRDRALIDPVGVADDAALSGLPEHLGEANHEHRAGLN
jgi:hypothetical protein